VRAERVPVQLLTAQCSRVIPDWGGEVAHGDEALVRPEQTLHESLKVEPEVTPPSWIPWYRLNPSM
jgi:hypothetical protein